MSKQKVPMVRRCTGTIYSGHLQLEETIDEFWCRLRHQFVEELGNWSDYFAGAFAKEECPSTGRIHIHFYLEHKRRRFSGLSVGFGIMKENFEIVRDAQGAWDYCTGSGAHREKPALDRFQFGTPKLHGDSSRADLKLLVGLVMEDIPVNDIIKAYPYAWCVHRARLLPFIEDWSKVTRELYRSRATEKKGGS